MEENKHSKSVVFTISFYLTFLNRTSNMKLLLVGKGKENSYCGWGVYWHGGCCSSCGVETRHYGEHQTFKPIHASSQLLYLFHQFSLMMVMSSILETFTCLTSMSFIVYDVYNLMKYQFIVFESRDQVSTYCFLVLGYCL